MPTAWYCIRPVPAGINRPMITFSFRPRRVSVLPLIAASVKTLVVSWNDAAEIKLSVLKLALVMPSNSGSAVAVTEDTCVIAYDIYFATHSGATEQVVTAVLKAVWEHVDALPPIHPTFKEWTRNRAAAAEVTIPYHPAAVKFYKDQGLWSSEMDQTQHRLLTR